MPKKRTKKARKQSSLKQINVFGRRLSQFQLVSLLAVFIFAGVGSYFIFFSKASTGDFVKLATHPQASALKLADGRDSTPTHRTLAALESWNGKLYAGYGDYGPNTGPIAITPFDPATNTFAATPEFTAETEAIWLWRVINGKLYAPSTDPRGQVDFAVGELVGGVPSWKHLTPTWTAHTFDMVSVSGNDLWIIGSHGAGGNFPTGDATACRSLDGGATCQMLVRSPPQKATCSSGGADFARYYGGGVYNGKLYVQAVDYCGYLHPKSKVYDPATNAVTDGPSIGTFNHAETFAGKMVFHSSYHSGVYQGALGVFNGTSTSYPCGCGIWDYEIAGNTIYVITTDKRIKKSTDLVNWQIVANAPDVGRSIAVVNDTIYVGGTDSSIYKYVLGSGTSSGGGSATNDTTAPSVSISSPANNSFVGNRVNIQATAADNVKVTRMEIYVGSTLLKTSTSGSIKYGWNTKNTISGPHTITVKAYDAAGNAGQASVTVNK